ncbi:complement resistance protein TraT [Nitrosomonas sp.]|uniref:complement resistance protein TraT n=1 Tax=Nitrosomonas sp. TaxID=42353 RepID=UPI0033055C70
MGYSIDKSTWILTGTMTLSLALSGCAAIHTSIAKKDLDVQTRMSNIIFLDPVEPEQKVIYLNIRNTSDKANFDIASSIIDSLQNKGYRITESPKMAHYWLQVSVLSVEKSSPTAAELALKAGYGGLGSAAMGAAVGSATGAAIDGWSGAGIGGLAGAAAFGLADTLAGAAVKDVTFMVITDVEIAERAEETAIVREDRQQDLQPEIEDSKRQSPSKVGEMNRYRTRIVSIANKVNLEYKEAAPELTYGLGRTISGLF